MTEPDSSSSVSPPRPPNSNPRQNFNRRRSTIVLLNTPEEFDTENENVVSFGGRGKGDTEPLGSWSSVVGRVLRDASGVEVVDEEDHDDVESRTSDYARQGVPRPALFTDIGPQPSLLSAGIRTRVNGIHVEEDGLSDIDTASHISAADSYMASELSPLLGTIHDPIPTSDAKHTTLNSINLLMGMGILTLPYAMSLCGWVIGVSLMVVFPILASTTVKLLVQCMEVRETSLPLVTAPQIVKSMSYGDTAETAFGTRGKNAVSALYLFELFAACTALVILTADSVHALYPQYSLPIVKCVVALLVLSTTMFKTVRVLSFFGFVGVVAIVNLVVIILVDGLSAESWPGSLWDPAETDLWPRSWQNVFLAVGIMFVGFDGHAVFPTIYRDLKTPTDFSKTINITYTVVTSLYLLVAVCGYRMFGNDILPEITQNLPGVPSYNPVLTQITLYLVALNPVAKYALCLRPVHAVLERGADQRWQHILIRTALTGAVLLMALAFPSFDKVMGLLGSLFSGSVAVLVPCACYAKLFWRGVGVGKKMMVVVGLVMGAGIVSLGVLGVALGGSNG
ncbi:hypothetical protein HDU90_008650 [Geranomyces variabilis]|nr:hypothetical protein HDU90_008650 [Geranomyces variabilis]